MFNKEEKTEGERRTEVDEKGIRPIIPGIKAFETPFIGSAGALVVLATILVMVGTGILYLFETARDNGIVQKQKEYDVASSTLNTGDMGKLQNDLKEIINGHQVLQSALATRLYWSTFWKQINDWTPKLVDYSSMTIDESGMIVLNGETSDYSSLARLMVTLQDEESIFENVEVGGFSQSTQQDKGVSRTVTSFSIRMNIKANLLLKNALL